MFCNFAKRVIYFLSLWVSLTIFGANTAWSCDCLPVPSAVHAARNSTLVFVGEVLEKQIVSVPQLGEGDTGYKEARLQVRVLRYWKGQPERILTIRTPLLDSHCGYDFSVKSTYLIYATGAPIPLVTRCSRTVDLASGATQAESDMKLLGTYRTFRDQESRPPSFLR